MLVSSVLMCLQTVDRRLKGNMVLAQLLRDVLLPSSTKLPISFLKMVQFLEHLMFIMVWL